MARKVNEKELVKKGPEGPFSALVFGDYVAGLRNPVNLDVDWGDVLGVMSIRARPKVPNSHAR